MTTNSRSASSILSRFARPTQENVCRQCRIRIERRHYAAAAAAAAPEQSNSATQVKSAEPTAATRTVFQIRAGVVLSRPPQITRDLTPFEKAFYLYQRRLNERLALPFTKYFYFRRDTPTELEWRRKMKVRKTPARELGGYNPYHEDGWNDELQVGAKESEPESQMEALLIDALPPASKKAGEMEGGEAQSTEQALEAIVRPAPRVTEADKKNDVKSLNRALQRTLYLVAKDDKNEWTFPSDLLIGNESLHLAAERILVQSGGVNMNTWVVGNAPIGHISQDHEAIRKTEQGSNELGLRTFFMKARIMAGQADLKQNKLGLKDFQWLVKEEVEKLVKPEYWKSIRNMLAER